MSAPFLRRLDAQTRVRIRPSPLGGVGVFAIQPIRKGADPFPLVRADVVTKFVPDEDLATLGAATREMCLDFCLPRVENGVSGRWVYVDGFAAMDTSYYLNDARDEPPNIEMCADPASTLCTFRATRDIVAGEELLFAYDRPPV